MPKVAIIDDKIDAAYMLRPEKISYKELESPGDISGKMTHATLCAEIFERMACDYELINVVITQPQVPADVGGLIRALGECVSLGVDIIALSMGTTKLSDTLKLYPAVKRAAQSNIAVIAAQSNGGRITLPAAYEEATGVAAALSLRPGEIMRARKNLWGVDVFAGYQSAFGSGGNSLAVPVVAARVNGYMAMGMSAACAKARLLQDAAEISSDEERLFSIRRDDIPYIYIKRCGREGDGEVLALLDRLALKHGVEAVCVSDGLSGDVRIMPFDDARVDGRYFENNFFADADVVILFISAQAYQFIRGFVTIDMEIIPGDGGFAFLVEGVEARRENFKSWADMADVIISLFEEDEKRGEMD